MKLLEKKLLVECYKNFVFNCMTTIDEVNNLAGDLFYLKRVLI